LEFWKVYGEPESGDRELSSGAVLRRFSSWAEGFRIKWEFVNKVYGSGGNRYSSWVEVLLLL
jgi:hypothetical protein